MSWALKLPINNGDYDETLKRKKEPSVKYSNFSELLHWQILNHKILSLSLQSTYLFILLNLFIYKSEWSGLVSVSLIINYAL